MYKIPQEVTAFIREHFRDGFLIDIAPSKNKNGDLTFKIKVDEDYVMHYLEFSSNGNLLSHESEPSFKEDYFEGSFYGSDES